MESQNETGCQTPKGPILCIKNCGFFGSATTAFMCSKCHKEILKEEEAKLAVESIVKGSSSSESVKEPVAVNTSPMPVDTRVAASVEEKQISAESSANASSMGLGEMKAKEKVGPNRCNTCRKRVGLTGFNCRCGDLFCSMHRYSDKHDCPFDYKAAAQSAIAKANPSVKAEKLDKI